jgi:hypothetical protein
MGRPKKSNVAEDYIDDIKEEKTSQLNFDKKSELKNESHDVAKISIIESLDLLQIPYDKDDSLEKLSLALKNGTVSMIQDGSANKADSDFEIKKWGGNTEITDLDFLRRLRKMGIDVRFVRKIINSRDPYAPARVILTDEHRNFTDRQIHAIIRTQGQGVINYDFKKVCREVGNQPPTKINHSCNMDRHLIK